MTPGPPGGSSGTASSSGRSNLTSRVVIFEFAGRRQNIALQLPHFQRILAEHPEVEIHLWNLAKTEADNQYLRRFETREPRIAVNHGFYGPSPWRSFNTIYRHYARDEFADTVFIKLDDDVVFFESRRLELLKLAVKDKPDAVISAKVVNNGACAMVDPGLRGVFERCGIPLLDVHRHHRFALDSHEYFFQHWPGLTNEDPDLIPTDDWLSINLIAYNHEMAKVIGQRLETRAPRSIAGRGFGPRDRMGDEGLVNTLPRIILQGFTAGHLSFGPQDRALRPVLGRLRTRYAEIGQKYLEAP